MLSVISTHTWYGCQTHLPANTTPYLFPQINETKLSARVAFRLKTRYEALHVQDIIRTALATSLVRRAPGITRARVTEQNGEAVGVSTEGINFPLLGLYDHVVDPTQSTATDVLHVLHTLGIEAARATIVQ